MAARLRIHCVSNAKKRGSPNMAKASNLLRLLAFIGAGEGIRTLDFHVANVALSR